MSAEASAEVKHVATVVRALITSRKPPCLLAEIVREYPEVEFKPLPYQALGYKTARELLEATGEFNFNSYGKDICITAKLSSKSQHIANLVRQQKSSTKRKHAAPTKAQAPRRPTATDHRSWNKSSYSTNVYGRQPPRANSLYAHQVNRAVPTVTAAGDRNNNQIVQNRPGDIKASQKEPSKQQPQAQPQAKKTQPQAKKTQPQVPAASAAAVPKKQQQNQQATIQKKTENSPAKPTENNFRDLRDMLNSKLTQKQQQKQQPQQQQQQQKKQPQLQKQQSQETLNNNLNGGQHALNDAVSKAQQQACENKEPKQTEKNSRDLRDMLNAKHMQTQQAQYPQQHHQQQQQQMQQQKQYIEKKSILQDRLNLNGRGGGPQQQQQQQQQQPQKLHERLQAQKAEEQFLMQIRQEKQQLLEQQQRQELQKQNKQQNYGSRPILGNGPANNNVPAIASNKNSQLSTTSSVGQSVQERLRIKINNGAAVSPTLSTNSSSTTSSPLISSAGSDIKQNPFVPKKRVEHSFQDKRAFQQQPHSKYDDPVALLAKYCLDKKYDAPAYSCAKSKFQRNVLCRVSINGAVYSTYPNEYPDEISARIACAKIALEKINEQEAKQTLPPCQYTDQEFIDVLHAALLKHPTGIFAKNMDKWYEQTFQEKLKENWWTLVHTSTQFKTEVNCDNIIVFANTNVIAEQAELKRSTSADALLHIEPIDLPWNERHWSLWITYCDSTTEVWARLFGAEYSARYDALMQEVEAHMQQLKMRPRAIVLQQIYLANVSSSWHRVRVEKLDKENGKAYCFFIDFGDADWLAVENLYICDLKFLQLPAQAVPFTLYGLEDFAGNPYARTTLDAQLAVKSVVAEIFTKELDFYCTESNTCGKVQAVMYDTSTPIDININNQLLEEICHAAPLPKLKKGLNNVHIQHVNIAGDVFLCLKNEDNKYVETLLHNIIASKFKGEQHQAVPADMKRGNVFLIRDALVSEAAGTAQWHRAVLAQAQPPRLTVGEYEMFYIDNGRTQRIPIANIYRLDSLCTALAKFPAQAIKVRLHNIPDITPTIVGRMRALLPSNCEAMLKVVEVTNVGTFVTAHIRQESGTLCTVNDTIRIEHELEECNDDLQNDASSVSSLNKSMSGALKPIKDMVYGLTVPNSPTKDGVLPKIKQYGTLPVYDDVLLEVRVSLSANPSIFTIQPYRDYPMLCKLMKELQEYCDNNDEFIPVDMVEVGQAYAAKHNENGFYHRVTVVNVYAEMIHVLYCDFGDFAWLRNDQLKILPENFRQLPQMAIHAKLFGIKPVGDNWTHDECIRFRELTVGQKFVAVIKNQSLDENEERVLELQLIDVSSDEDIFIHEILLTEQRARLA